MPTDDVASAVVNTTSATDVVMTMVGGTILYENSKWETPFDVEEAVREFVALRKDLRD